MLSSVGIYMFLKRQQSKKKLDMIRAAQKKNPIHNPSLLPSINILNSPSVFPTACVLFARRLGHDILCSLLLA